MSDFFLDYENGNDANTGADWANAWKTITLGATAARIAPGDRVKIAKSPDPVSIGNATWNDLSKTVTLAAALTLLVDDCESGWSADNSSTLTHPTTAMKSGSANLQVTKATYATSTLYAHKQIASTDYSAYTKLTFWVRNSAAIANAATWEVRLCSDTAGATVVDTFAIPAIPSTARWVPLTIARTGGGTLGAAIQSISIATSTTAPTNASTLQIDNINACTAFSLQSLISKSSAAQSTSEGWYVIQSISGTTVLLDNDTETIASAGRGYSGATETATTYRRETIKTAMAVSALSTLDVQAVQESGAEGSLVTYSGGWNTSSGLQDGESFFDGQNGYGNGLSTLAFSFLEIERLSFARYSSGLRLFGGTNITATIGTVCGCTSANAIAVQISVMSADITIASGNNNAGATGAIAVGTADACHITVGNLSNNSGVGIGLGTMCGSRVSAAKANNNGTFAVSIGSGGANVITMTEARGNATAAVTQTRGAHNILRDSVLTGTEVSGLVDYADSRLYSHNHDLSGYDHIFTDGGDIYSEATDFDSPATGKMWTLLTSAVTRTSSYPLKLRLRGVAVVANKLVTIKAMMRKGHATQVNGRLVLPGGQIAGVAADVVATLADATTEEELTITFTPTEAGVVVPEVWAEYVSGHAAVCIDRLTSVTQAA